MQSCVRESATPAASDKHRHNVNVNGVMNVRIVALARGVQGHSRRFADEQKVWRIVSLPAATHS